MRKASTILYLVAGIVNILLACLFLVLGIVNITALSQAAAGEPEAAPVVVIFGGFMIVACVLSILCSIMGFRGYKGKLGSTSAIVVGAIATFTYGCGTLLLLAGIFGAVADHQGQ